MITFVVVGLGGLGTPLAAALARSVDARLVLVDDDVVERSNLQRQILYRTEDVGRPKVEAAREALARRGARRVEALRTRFTAETARAIAHDATVLVDGTDSLSTKFLVNDVGVALGKPFTIAGVLRHAGQLFAVRPGVDACYRCLFEAPPAEELATCADAGVLGATCGVVAAWQAKAALALATGQDPDQLIGRVHLFEEDAVRAIELAPRPGCEACHPRHEARA